MNIIIQLYVLTRSILQNKCVRYRFNIVFIIYHIKNYKNIPIFVYTLSVQNIRNILSLSSEQPQFFRAWTLQGVESLPQGCWPLLTPMLLTVVWSWLDVFWEVDHLDTHRKQLSVKYPAVFQFLIHSNWCAWLLQPYPVQRPLNRLSYTFTLWMAHIHNWCLNRLRA